MNLLNISKSWLSRSYAKKQILIYAGDRIDRFYYLSNGYIKVYSIRDDGDERILLILRPGDLFPLLKDSSQDGQVSLYFYSAMTDIELHTINQNELIFELKNNHEAAWELLRYTSEFSSILTNRLAHLENKTAKEKLSSLFVYLISVCGKPTKLNYYVLDLRLTHQDIASLIGITRETASFAMKELEKQNKVLPKGGFLLVHKDYVQDI